MPILMASMTLAAEQAPDADRIAVLVPVRPESSWEDDAFLAGFVPHAWETNREWLTHWGISLPPYYVGSVASGAILGGLLFELLSRDHFQLRFPAGEHGSGYGALEECSLGVDIL